MASNRLTHYDKFVGPRIVALYEAATEIFGLNTHDWSYLRRTINADQVRDFYRFIYRLWPPDMTVDDYLPPPDSTKLRALYIGQESPRTIERKISRYSLYNDQIIVSLPLLNPRIMAEAYNPVLHPEIYLENTLQSLAFLYNISPWIQNGQVLPIPNPIDYTDNIRRYVFDLATNRDKLSKEELRAQIEQDPNLMDEHKDDFIGFYLRVPEKHRFSWLKQTFPELPDSEIVELEKTVKWMRENDPYILDQDASTTGEIHMMKVGSTVEVGEYICHATGSYMYTDMQLQWDRILKTQASHEDPNSWSALTQAFQNLQFRFLDKVDPRYASNIAGEGRLASFRSFLRDVWQTCYKEKDPEKLRQSALIFSDRLTYEYHLAQEDWDKIDRELLRWFGSSAGVGTIVSGLMNPAIPLAGFCASSIIQLVNSTKRRKNFKRTIPMAIFLDLDRHKALKN